MLQYFLFHTKHLFGNPYSPVKEQTHKKLYQKMMLQ